MDKMQTFMHILARLQLLIVHGGGERARRRSNSNEPNAPIAPREELSIIMIIINCEKEDQHKKCINSTKTRGHEHHDHDQPRGR